MNTAAEQVVPAMAAIKPNPPAFSGRPGIRPSAITDISGRTMKKTVTKLSPIRMTKTMSIFSKS